MGLNYPFFIGNQLIFLTFCSRIDPRRRRCPRWPGFGLFPASMRSVRVEVGLKLSVFHWKSTLIKHFLLYIQSKGQRVPKMARFWAVSGLHEVHEG